MIYIAPVSFFLGVIVGIVGFGLILGITAALLTFVGSDTDKRGLSGRHRPADSRTRGKL